MSAPESRLRRRTLLSAAFWFLLAAALLVVLLPTPAPLPLRLAVAATDLVAASVVWLALRQNARARHETHRPPPSA